MEKKIPSKSYSLPKLQATKVWHDIEKDKYYRLDNQTGEMKPSKQQGDLLTKFIPEISGNNYEQLIPDRCKSLAFQQQLSYYTPQQDKFFGYQQYYNLRVKPYQNELKNPKQLLEKLKNTTLLNIKNKQCIERRSSGLIHLTGTLKSLKQKQSENSIQVLATKNGVRQQTKLVKPENNLADTVKIINGRKLNDPNLQRYDHFTSRRMQKQDEIKQTIKTKQAASIRQRNLFDTLVHQTRFESKTSQIRTTLFEGRSMDWQNSIYGNTINQNSSLSFPMQSTVQMNRTSNYNQNLNEMSWTLRDYKMDIQREQDSRKMLAKNQRVECEKKEKEKTESQRISCKGRFGTIIDEKKMLKQEKQLAKHYLDFIGINSKNLSNSLKRKMEKKNLNNQQLIIQKMSEIVKN